MTANSSRIFSHRQYVANYSYRSQLSFAASDVPSRSSSGWTSTSTLVSDSPPRPDPEKSGLSEYTLSGRLVDPTWRMELFSILVATLCLCSIVIVLGIYEHQPPLLELPFAITINSILAIITAVFKGFLIMPIAEGISQSKWIWFTQPRTLHDIERLDLASRGPWGCLRLLVGQLPGYSSPWLASLGAFITLATLAADPFSQQIIKFYTCTKPVPGARAEIPTAHNYVGESLYTPTYKRQFLLDSRMTAAIYTGLLDPPDKSSSCVTVNCQSGNCTFSEEAEGSTFSTLAMCGSCSDISNQIETGHSTNTSSKYPDIASIPSGATITGETQFSSRAPKTNDTSTSLFTFESIMSRLTTQKPGEKLDPYALRCSLTPCVKTYKASMENKLYQESEVSSKNLRMNNLGYFSLAVDSAFHNGTKTQCLPSREQTITSKIPVNRKTREIINDNTSGHSDKDIKYYSEDCVYYFGNDAVKTMEYFLISLYDNKTLFSATNLPVDTLGELWLKNLYNDGHLNIDTANHYMTRLAWSISGIIRQYSSDTDARLKVAVGTVHKTDTCVRVRWAWLSFPATLLGLGLAFLIGIIVSWRKVPWHEDWKSSPLALLYHGLVEEMRPRSGDLLGKKDMCAVAKETKVCLRKEGDEWRFVGTS